MGMNDKKLYNRGDVQKKRGILMAQGVYGQFSVREKQFFLAATPYGLCYMNIYSQSIDDFPKFVKRWFPHFKWEQDNDQLKGYIDEYMEYFQGTRQTFTFPMELRGTDFQLKTWNVLKNIPYGQVTSYSDIAHKLDNPKAVRAVGGAVGANPLLICIPCHRVIGKDGRLTGFSAGLELKKELLSIENSICMTMNDEVKLSV